MIFLKENSLLRRELSRDDIKPRLLGHWGTCPGLVLIYAHLNRVIRNTGQDMLYVVGPGTYITLIVRRVHLKSRSLGHGAPALLSCLWLENSLSTYYPQYTRDKDGLHKLISRFSVPGGFPRRVATSTPHSPL